MKKGRSVATFVIVPFIIGAIGIMAVARSPEYSAFRAVDVVQLIASGMCFGVSLAWIFRGLRAS